MDEYSDMKIMTMETPPPEELLSMPFCYRADLPGPEDALARSVSAMGLISPPLLIEDPGLGRVVLLGHRRLAAAGAAGLERVNALCLAGEASAAIGLWLEDASSGRPLSGLEKLKLLERVEELSGGSSSAYLSRLSPVFGRSITDRLASRLLAFLDLGEDVLSSLHDGSLGMGELLSLDGHPGIELGQAARMLCSEKMSRGSRKEAARLMLYLADQGEERWRSFLEARSEDADAGEAEGKSLLESLRAACFPRLGSDISRVRSLVGGMGLPAWADIQVPRDLESGSFRLMVKIRKEDDAAVALEKLEKALGDGTIGKILDIIRAGGR